MASSQPIAGVAWSRWTLLGLLLLSACGGAAGPEVALSRGTFEPFRGPCGNREFWYAEPFATNTDREAWPYEFTDTNYGVKPEAWLHKFLPDNYGQWATARSRMDWYVIHTRLIEHLAQIHDAGSNPALYEAVVRCLAFLAERRVAYNSIAMTLAPLDDSGIPAERQDRLANYQNMASKVKWLEDHGVRVHAVLMQSTMSKGDLSYSIEDRAGDSVHFVQSFTAYLNQRGVTHLPAYGLIDASVALGLSDWQFRHHAWVQAMRAIGQEPLVMVQDYPATAVIWDHGAEALVDAMAYDGLLEVPSVWWLAAGQRCVDSRNAQGERQEHHPRSEDPDHYDPHIGLSPAQAHWRMDQAIAQLKSVTGWSDLTTGVLFGDFHMIWHRTDDARDWPDTVNGAPWTATESFNAFYQQLWTLRLCAFRVPWQRRDF